METLAVAPVEGQVRGIRLAGLLALGIVVVGSIVELGPLCPLRRLSGLACPLCGLTTGVASAVRGDVAGSVAAHPLALVTAVLLVGVWTPAAPVIVTELRRRPLVIAAVLTVVWAARLLGLYGS